MKRMKRVVIGLVAVLVLLALAVVGLNFRDEEGVPSTPVAFSFTEAQVKRGEYLARAGNCMTCHTARGGAPYAGGRGIDTPFGTVYAANLTPHEASGIGSWSPAHFWRALHNGRSKDGRLLYPAFPYPNFTHVTREDSDAIFAFLRTLAPVAQSNRDHALRFPYDSQAALAVWRALFFAPGTFEPERGKGETWNRGAYLVRGLGHCNACHGSRNLLGATDETLELSGGLIPMQQWYAPSLAAANEAGVAQWDVHHIVSLIKSGVAPGASVMGPMAEVVYRSTQYLSDTDLGAIAVFLKALPPAAVEAPEPKASDEEAKAKARVDESQLPRGRQVYEEQCAECHGKAGEGVAGAYLPLAGNRAVTMASPANLIRVVLSGGYPPATAGNPRPYGMPPFSHVLDDSDVAAVVTYVRDAWGNAAPPVSTVDVLQYRR